MQIMSEYIEHQKRCAMRKKDKILRNILVSFAAISLTLGTEISQGAEKINLAKFKHKILQELDDGVTANGAAKRRLLLQTDFKFPLLVVDQVTPNKANTTEIDAIKALTTSARVADHIIVKIKPGVSEKDLADFCTSMSCSIKRKLKVDANSYIIKLKTAEIGSVSEALAKFEGSGLVESSSADQIVQAIGLPNDEKFGALWGLHNTGVFPEVATVSSGFSNIKAYPMFFSPTTDTSGVTGVLYDCGIGKPDQFPADVRGNLALIARGELYFRDKVNNAMAAGATGVIIYNNEPGSLDGKSLIDPKNWVPVVGITDKDGKELHARGNVPVTIVVPPGTPDADIDAPEAWEISKGSKDIIVGVIDSGVDYNHPDLAPNMWVNTGEIPGNGIDDDKNGFIDDIHGYDFSNNDGDPMDDNSDGDTYHGTHCAGTIGAVGNNSIGVIGVCPTVRIMALKFLDKMGSGATSDAMEALNYAVKMKARITSNSWGGGGFSSEMNKAIVNAKNAGTLFVAAAGNEGTNNDEKAYYPCGYKVDNVISVAATKIGDALAGFSQYGLNSVHIGAPGENIYSTKFGNSYQALSGTSMATPHIAGALALMMAVRPDQSSLVLKDQLMATVDKIPALKGKCISEGRLNLAKAVSAAQSSFILLNHYVLEDVTGNNDQIANPGESLQLGVSLKNVGSDSASKITARLSTQDPYASVSAATANFGDIAAINGVVGSTEKFTVVLSPSTPTPRNISFSLEIQDSNGKTWTESLTMTVYTTAFISGQVINKKTGEPAKGVRVSCIGTVSTSIRTDINGTYKAKVVDGIYKVQALKPDEFFDSEIATVSVPPDAIVNFSMGFSDINVQPTTLSSMVTMGETSSLEIRISSEGTDPLVWVSDSRVNPGSLPGGSLLRQFSLVSDLQNSYEPYGLAYLNNTLFVSTAHRLPSKAILKFNAQNGSSMGNIIPDFVKGNSNSRSYRMGYDGVNLWVTQLMGGIMVIDPISGMTKNRFPMKDGDEVLGIDADYKTDTGWVLNGKTLTNIRMSTGATLENIALPTVINKPTGLSMYNGAIWIFENGTIYRLDPKSLAVTKTVKTSIQSARDISDDNNGGLWLVTGGLTGAKKGYLVDLGEPMWLKASIEKGTTAVDKFQTIKVTLDSRSVGEGTHAGQVLIYSNDPDEATTTIPVTFTVNRAPNKAPTVSISNPTNNQTFKKSSPVMVKANASDTDGKVVKVEFYLNNVLQASDNTTPFEWSSSTLPSGNHILNAKAFDNDGATTVSGIVNFKVSDVVNKLPTVKITSPWNSQKYRYGDKISFKATASDSDGTIAKIVFFANGNQIGEDTTAPYDMTWRSNIKGNVTLKAQAYDNDGGSSPSEVIILVR